MGFFGWLSGGKEVAEPTATTETEEEKSFRVALSKKVGDIIASAFALLGIQVPERM